MTQQIDPLRISTILFTIVSHPSKYQPQVDDRSIYASFGVECLQDERRKSIRFALSLKSLFFTYHIRHNHAIAHPPQPKCQLEVRFLRTQKERRIRRIRMDYTGASFSDVTHPSLGPCQGRNWTRNKDDDWCFDDTCRRRLPIALLTFIDR